MTVVNHNERPDPERATAALNRITAAGLIGTVIEYYDFFLYATAAALVFGPVYFPHFAPATATLASMATFATGFLARPLGAALFGHIGDRLGRRTLLLGTVLTTGGATVGMGLLPGYQELGLAAPVCLVALRLLQGVGIGGEWTGAVVLATEHAPARRRGLWASFPQIGPALGFLLANGSLLALTATLDAQEFQAWGWRVPFWCAGLLTLIGYVLRSSILESPAFRALAEDRALSRAPVLQVIGHHSGRVLLIAGAVTCAYAVHYTVTTWAMSHATTTMGLDPTGTLLSVTIAMTVMAATTPLAAALGDRFGRRRLGIIGCTAMAALMLPYLALLQTGSLLALTAGTTVELLALVTMLGVQGAYIPELFDARIRSTGTAVAYNIGAVFGGGLTPLVNSRLSEITATGFPWLTAAYVICLCGASLLCLLRLPSTQPPSEDRHRPASILAADGEHPAGCAARSATRRT
ncbi:MFS transporter [Streptomyces sp. Ru73]|uniref:MFS transporter n=1 Tax=Streptomyces sp. Ru73 TaxID=2080748 RepID=UPI000CDE104E|nr:MFS transporter [Streptomyces sp. Ru73]POX36697.1 MFS transporter [Streptomyces sp. Ru73]